MTHKQTIAERAVFLKEFIERPAMIGAITPSSAHLAKLLVDTVDLQSARAIAEYGPGTGVVTDEILRRLPAGARFFAVENSPAMAQDLRQVYPGLHVHARSAEEIEQIAREEGVASLDIVISGLPWASFPEDLQKRILTATAKVLRPGGEFITFGYHVGLLTPAGRRFRRALPTYFSTIGRSRTIWRNLPPAYAIRCVK